MNVNAQFKEDRDRDLIAAIRTLKRSQSCSASTLVRQGIEALAEKALGKNWRRRVRATAAGKR